MSTEIIYESENKMKKKRKIGSGALGDVYEVEKGVAVKVMNKK